MDNQIKISCVYSYNAMSNNISNSHSVEGYILIDTLSHLVCAHSNDLFEFCYEEGYPIQVRKSELSDFKFVVSE